MSLKNAAADPMISPKNYKITINYTGPKIERWMLELPPFKGIIEEVREIADHWDYAMKKISGREIIFPKIWNNRAKRGLYYKLRCEVDDFGLISDERRQEVQAFYVKEEEDEDEEEGQEKVKADQNPNQEVNPEKEKIPMPENEEKQKDQPRKKPCSCKNQMTEVETTPTLSPGRLFMGSQIVEDITKQHRGLVTKCEGFIEEEEEEPATMPPMSLMPSHLKWERPICVSTLIPSRQAPKLKKKDVLRVIQGRYRYT